MKMKIAQLQQRVSSSKEENIDNLRKTLEKIRCECEEKGESMPDLVTVGEMFTCPYQTENFPVYAEPDKGPTWHELSRIAREYGIYLQAGSIPVRADNGDILNSAYVFDRDGKEIARHDKVHLFDIYFTNGDGFKESDTLTAGDHFTVFDTEFGKIGLIICFDIRFVEIARICALEGARMILVPAAFNMTTGPAHWELTFRARALDNQVYMAGTSVARDPESGYTSWGHSILVSPWAEVIQQLDEKESYMINEIELDEVDRIRRKLPILNARRTDLYELKHR